MGVGLGFGVLCVVCRSHRGPDRVRPDRVRPRPKPPFFLCVFFSLSSVFSFFSVFSCVLFFVLFLGPPFPDRPSPGPSFPQTALPPDRPKISFFYLLFPSPKFRSLFLSLRFSRGIVTPIQGHGPHKLHVWAPWGHFVNSRRPLEPQGFEISGGRGKREKKERN